MRCYFLKMLLFIVEVLSNLSLENRFSILSSLSKIYNITYADTYSKNGLTCLVSYEERDPSTGLTNELYIRKVFMSSTGRKRSLFSSSDRATAMYYNS